MKLNLVFIMWLTGGRLTVNDLAKKIIELTESSSKIEYAPVRAGDVKHLMASVEKLAAAGFKPTSFWRRPTRYD